MRIFFTVVMILFVTMVKSQTVLSPAVGMNPQSGAPSNNGILHDSLSTHKWFITSFSGLSTSVSFFKRGNASVFSAPMGLQLNRRLNNNWYAFANVAVAPSYMSINPSYLNGFNKKFSGNNFKQNSFGLYPAASLGVMYVNDARTFSISGSISAERGVYPVMPYYQNPATQHAPLMPGRQ
jgi:hypothetical protein